MISRTCFWKIYALNKWRLRWNYMTSRKTALKVYYLKTELYRSSSVFIFVSLDLLQDKVFRLLQHSQVTA